MAASDPLGDLPHRTQVEVGAVAAVSFLPVATAAPRPPFEVAVPAGLAGGLQALEADPLALAEPGAFADLRTASTAWLDGFDDEPEGAEYWLFQALTAVEYAFGVRDSGDPALALRGLRQHCVDFGYFLDQDEDGGGGRFQEAQETLWTELTTGQGARGGSPAALLARARVLGQEVLSAARTYQERNPYLP